MSYEQFGYLEQKKANRKNSSRTKVGDVWETDSFGQVKVISFELKESGEYARVRFLNTGSVQLFKVHEILRGKIADHSLANRNWTGHIVKTKFYGPCVIIDNNPRSVHANKKKVDVRFTETGNVNTDINLFHLLKRGTKDFWRPTVNGVGYLGKGKYKTMNGNKKEPAIDSWNGMLTRVYGDNPKNKSATYQEYGVTVCEEWHNFQNFARWYHEEVKYREKGWHLDKDYLNFGTKEYCPENCTFLPTEINCFVAYDHRKLGYRRRGVRYVPKHKGWFAKVGLGSTNNWTEYGPYKTDKEAFLKYKLEKEKLAIKLADRWDGRVDPRIITMLRTLDIQPVYPE